MSDGWAVERLNAMRIRIDTEEGTIMATDRVSGVQLWEDDFHPAWIRLSQIQVVISGETYKHPALVYSEEPLEDGHGCCSHEFTYTAWIGRVGAVQSVQRLFIGELNEESPADEA